MKTQVGIIGAGPAGLLLQRMLHNNGIDSIILENRNEDFLRTRLRLGIQEIQTTGLIIQNGVGEKLLEDRMVHSGIRFHYNGKQERLNLAELTGTSGVTTYGQKFLTGDLINKAHEDGLNIIFEAKGQRFEGLTEERPIIHYSLDGKMHTIECDFIVGCDGFNGISRPSIPSSLQKVYRRNYPYSWYGILVDAPPAMDEFVYAHHPNGFALQAMHTKDTGWYYLQCPTSTEIRDLEEDYIWDELETRLGIELQRGEILDKSVNTLRSFACERMQHGRLFIAGEAAHLVPPMAGKGMNMSMADVDELSKGLIAHYHQKDASILDGYSETCFKRTMEAERFTWWMTKTFHIDPEQTEFDTRMQEETIAGVVDRQEQAMGFAGEYVGKRGN